MNLDARLSALEAKLRRLRIALGVCFVAAASVVLLGQAGPANRVLEADGLAIRDSRGVERVRLAVAPDDSVSSLSLRNRDGGPRVILSSAEDGTSSLIMLNAEGKAQLVARVKGYGPATVELADSTGRPRARLAVDKDGNADVSLRDGRTSLASLSSGSEGATRLTLKDGAGRERAFIAVGPDGTAAFHVEDGRTAESRGQDTPGKP